MAIPTSIQEYLEGHNVAYWHHEHPQAFTSPQAAEALEMSGKVYAKTVVVVVDGRLVMAAVPANERVDVEKLAQIAGASSARLATEAEFESRFPECELGAMPPFGGLFDMPVWLDASFEKQPTLAFDAGTHTDSVELGLEDFQRLSRPRVARITEVDEATRSVAILSMKSVERQIAISGVAPFVSEWTAAQRERPVTLELTREDGVVARERDTPLIDAHIRHGGFDKPSLEITLGDERGGGRRVTYRVPGLRKVSVNPYGPGDHEELVFEGEGRAKAILRVGASPTTPS